MAGIVTGVRTYGSSRGFWMQDPNPDANPATSEGVFVFTCFRAEGRGRRRGDRLRHGLRVRPRAAAATGNQSLTEITKPTVTVVSSGNAVPAATVITARSVPSRLHAGRRHRGERHRQRSDAAAFEVRPGLLRVPGGHERPGHGRPRGRRHRPVHRAVGHGEAAREPRSPRGGTVYGSYDSQNTGRLQIQSLVPTAPTFPVANVGDSAHRHHRRARWTTTSSAATPWSRAGSAR